MTNHIFTSNIDIYQDFGTYRTVGICGRKNPQLYKPIVTQITIYVPTARDQSNYNGFEHDTFLFCDVRDVFEPFFYPERSEG